ncbi:MAG: hypothetical protein R3E39_11300 [Anaerolineae bacterium]
MKDVSLRYLVKCVLVALTAYAGLNGAAFLFLFGNALQPLQLPYSEDFEQVDRLRYRQFGGLWKVQDGALLQSIENDSDLMAVLPVRILPEQSYHLETHITFRSGNSGGGLMFNLEHPDNRREGHMVRFGADAGSTYIVYGYFDELVNFTSQGGGAFDFTSSPDGVVLAVEVIGDHYTITVNDQTAAVDVPVLYHGDNLALTTWFSQVAFDDVTVRTLEPVVPAAIVNTPVPEFIAQAATPVIVNSLTTGFSTRFDAAVDQSKWQPISGNWMFEPGALVQTQGEGYDHSITYLEPFSQYSLTARFNQRAGSGGGVLFNMPQADSQAGAHMVRYFPDNQLVWGYFDANLMFQGQGNATIAEPGVTSHQLQVHTNGSTYDIQLDGQAVANDIPLTSRGGYVALTSSTSIVAFEQLDIQPLNVQSNNTLVVPIGDWTVNDKTITQNRTDNVHFNRATGVYGETFTVSADITLPDDAAEPVSGGLAFHANSTDNPAGGLVVRLHADQQVTWGTLDADNAFQQQGSVPVGSGSGTHNLMLRVQKSAYDIVLDGQVIAISLPLEASAGWLYFDAVGGPVTFRNFNMNLSGG